MYPGSGKLEAVMHVAVILQDCRARHTVIVLAKPCASILSPNVMRMKLDMIMRMKVIVWRKREWVNNLFNENVMGMIYRLKYQWLIMYTGSMPK